MRNDGFLKWLIIAIIVLILCICTAKATEYVGSVKRFTKGMESNWSGGLKRVVTLYDYNGKILKQWYGKIDMSESEIETDFIVDGRRVIIHGGIAVIEEEK